MWLLEELALACIQMLTIYQYILQELMVDCILLHHTCLFYLSYAAR